MKSGPPGGSCTAYSPRPNVCRSTSRTTSKFKMSHYPLVPGHHGHGSLGSSGRRSMGCPIPAGRWLPRPHTTPRPGTMPGLDHGTGAADLPRGNWWPGPCGGSGRPAWTRAGELRAGGRNPPGTPGNVMRRSVPSAASAGGLVRPFRNSWVLWRQGKKAVRPLTHKAPIAPGPPDILETTA